MAAAEKLEELCTLSRVRAMTGLGTTFIYGEIKDGRFPKPIHVGRRSLWVLSEVQQWVAQQIKRNRPLPAGG
ncbi:helix-turn-helix transcriptional regulator [Xanthomonas sp. NCPPB 3005]|uniref:helix-turn-helix transcriptional regulator n=1 Tax=Xanthomonas sp. NCPPB 3005 TaxID=3240913 RepID=UPI0035131DEE